MKIVHISHTYLDGYTYQDNDLSEAHAKLGHDVTVISTQDYAGCFYFPIKYFHKEALYYYGKCKIIRLPLKYKCNYRFAVYDKLYETLINENPDLIYFHTIPYFCYYDIIKYKRKKNCKLVVDFHCDSYNSAKNIITKYLLHHTLYRCIIQLTKRYVDQYYAVTPGSIDFVYTMYGLDKNRIKLLPLGGDLDKIKLYNNNNIRKQTRKELDILDNQIVIVTAGKINSEKKTIDLIKSVKMFHNNNIVLLIIGPIENEYKIELEKQIENQSEIKLLGWKDPIEIYRYFFASDLACFPGTQSVIWQQAICCGLPLICRYWPGGEYLDCGGNVVFIKENSAIGIYNIIKNILDSDSILKKMQHISQTIGIDRFSYMNIAQTILNDVFHT